VRKERENFDEKERENFDEILLKPGDAHKENEIISIHFFKNGDKIKIEDAYDGYSCSISLISSTIICDQNIQIKKDLESKSLEKGIITLNSFDSPWSLQYEWEKYNKKIRIKLASNKWVKIESK